MAQPLDHPFARPRKVFLVSPDPGFAALLMALWPEGALDVVPFARGRGAVEHIFNEPPDLLIVDNALEDMTGPELVGLIKSENVYRQLPVILVLAPADLCAGLNWREIEADELLIKPANPDELRARIVLTLSRASRSFDSNPLSKLPGNTSIITRIQDLIDRGEDFALAYCDLDYFKSYNDRYGFSRGDEALMMAARVVVNTVRGVGGPKAFVGHVGGDDFVFITPPEMAEEACKRIVAAFDAIVPNFYDPEDRRRGYIQSVDREGKARTFPLMAISIAVVVNVGGRLKHYGEASQIAMTLKKKAKENPKSCYVVDRRQKASDDADA